ncbi:MAG: glycerophosphodiester phosphodiesterase family protein [Gammaproteobacteria bacterium]|nr:glycerophosphodiester phosphodiesterase family protein [Gammaproteobacteria bacterium]
MVNKFILPEKISPPIIAHRGASHLAPENTLAAFRMAHVSGARWVEFDVMMAACGELIVFHDRTLERTTFATGDVSDFAYEYLSTLDAGSWFDPIFRDEKIPRLTEVLNLLSHYKMAANIEIKASQGNDVEIAHKIFQVVNAWQSRHPIPLFFSSFSVLALETMRQISSEVSLALLLDQWCDEGPETLERLNCHYLSLRQEDITSETLQSVKLTQKKILAWTVNEPARAAQLFDWGVHAVFTDVPEVLIAKMA